MKSITELDLSKAAVVLKDGMANIFYVENNGLFFRHESSSSPHLVVDDLFNKQVCLFIGDELLSIVTVGNSVNDTPCEFLLKLENESIQISSDGCVPDNTSIIYEVTAEGLTRSNVCSCK